MEFQLKNLFEDITIEQKEVFCKEFDIHCFDVYNPAVCKAGKSAVIEDIRYYTLPVTAICPLCDNLQY
jgi:hypothetical protein